MVKYWIDKICSKIHRPSYGTLVAITALSIFYVISSCAWDRVVRWQLDYMQEEIKTVEVEILTAQQESDFWRKLAQEVQSIRQDLNQAKSDLMKLQKRKGR